MQNPLCRTEVNLPASQSLIIAVEFEAMNGVKAGLFGHYRKQFNVLLTNRRLCHVLKSGTRETEVFFGGIHHRDSIGAGCVLWLRQAANRIYDFSAELFIRVLLPKVLHFLQEPGCQWRSLADFLGHRALLTIKLPHRFGVVSKRAKQIQFVQGAFVEFYLDDGSFDQVRIQVVTDCDKTPVDFEDTPNLCQRSLNIAVFETKLRGNEIEAIIVERLTLARRVGVKLDSTTQCVCRLLVVQLRFDDGQIGSRDEKSLGAIVIDLSSQRSDCAIACRDVEYLRTVW